MALPRFCSNCAAPLPGPPPVTCRACDTSHWLDAKPCAGALVVHDGRLLLVRRAHEPWRGSWDVPGGFCGPREHPSETAAREVREETGLVVRVGDVLGMWIDTYAPDGPDADKVTLNIYFHATPELAPEAVRDPNEVTEIAWFSSDQLPEDLAFPGHIPAVLRSWKEAIAREPARKTAAERSPSAHRQRERSV
jgi:8-oxo-dGTP diphosphatase